MPILVRTMTSDDLPAGLSLSAQAGWNQTQADWRRVLSLEPTGCFVAEREGAVVGTVASCRFGPVAWIAMMLVDPSCRRRGIGRALMEHVLEFLDEAGVRSVRLDATPMGRPLYESLGFTLDVTLPRYQGVASFPGGPEAIAPATADRLPEVAALDQAATGADRTRLLEALARDNPGALRVVARDGSITGYALERPGRRWPHVGPCIGDDQAGARLLGAAFHRHTGREIIVDIPEDHQAARALAEAAGLKVARTLARMTRGPAVAERPASIWASSGPEMG